MSDFFSLFTIFASSSFFSWVLEILVPFIAIYSGMSLVGGIIHGKSV